MMGHDGHDLTGVCLARFAFFFVFHFSAYTEKDQGGLGWVGLGCWFITFFFIFSGTHVW